MHRLNLYCGYNHSVSSNYQFASCTYWYRLIAPLLEIRTHLHLILVNWRRKIQNYIKCYLRLVSVYFLCHWIRFHIYNQWKSNIPLIDLALKSFSKMVVMWNLELKKLKQYILNISNACTFNNSPKFTLFFLFWFSVGDCILTSM